MDRFASVVVPLITSEDVSAPRCDATIAVRGLQQRDQQRECHCFIKTAQFIAL
jgi:hypothetical protein